MENFGSYIREALKHKNMSREDFANQLGVTVSSISYYISGKVEPPFSTIIRICMILDIDLNLIYGLKHADVTSEEYLTLLRLRSMNERDRGCMESIIDVMSVKD